MEETDPPAEKPNPPSMAFRCPECQFGEPKADEDSNGSTDRRFTCPACGHKWSVSPIADSN